MKQIILPLCIAATALATACAPTTRQEAEKNLHEELARDSSVLGKPYKLVHYTRSEKKWLLTVQGHKNNIAACEKLVGFHKADHQYNLFPGEYVCESIH